MLFKKTLQSLRPLDFITFLYLLVTGLFIIFTFSKIENAGFHLLSRVAFVGIILLIHFLFIKFPNRFFKFISNFYIFAFLGFFYAETDALNNVFFPYLDPVFAKIENILFNGQPSISFYKTFPHNGFIELMNFAYFCYYPLILFFCFWLYKKKSTATESTVFIISSSFFIYYIIFIIIPVAGPQYYFSPPHNHVPQAFVFSKIMYAINCIGERPTAAFPSSHVGMICILWYLSFKHVKPLLYFYLPIGLLLFFSTVYIKAHYLIDVIAGIITAPLLYYLSAHLYNIVSSIQQKPESISIKN